MLAAAATEPISVDYDVIAKHPELGERLSADVSATTNTVTLGSALNFSTIDQFTIQIGDEQMTVTAVADRVLTVIRGANGTVASSHGLGETVTVVTDNSLTASVSASDTAITVNDLLLFPPDPSV